LVTINSTTNRREAIMNKVSAIEELVALFKVFIGCAIVFGVGHILAFNLYPADSAFAAPAAIVGTVLMVSALFCTVLLAVFAVIVLLNAAMNAVNRVGTWLTR
jgi:hypothetical protein